jgi:GNAT superfamily N-acetyltransferase
MTLTLQPVNTKADLLRFVQFPAFLNKNDPYWVPPLISDMLTRLDVEKNSFWKSADYKCWLVEQDGEVVGRICAIADHTDAPHFDQTLGKFGFFECIDDPNVAELLFSTAGDWLKDRGFSIIRGPYNPTANDEAGVLVEGFNERPVIMTGHNPPYYESLLLQHGFTQYQDLVARLFRRQYGTTFEQAIPEKLTKAAKIAAKRSDILIRPLNKKNWESEIKLATDIYNTALSPLPGFVPIPLDEFMQLANGFKPILDPSMALIAEVGGKPVGYALAFPDVNEAFQKINGKMNLLGTFKFLFALKNLHRVSFKILMMLPEYQSRGIEALLIYKVSEAIWEKGFTEVDMSLAGDENIKSNRIQENLGFKVYLRFRVYEKSL